MVHLVLCTLDSPSSQLSWFSVLSLLHSLGHWFLVLPVLGYLGSRFFQFLVTLVVDSLSSWFSQLTLLVLLVLLGLSDIGSQFLVLLVLPVFICQFSIPSDAGSRFL